MAELSEKARRYNRLVVEEQTNGKYRWVFLVKGQEDEVIARSTDVLESQDEAVAHARATLNKTLWNTIFITRPLTGEALYDERTFLAEIEQTKNGRWRFRCVAVREDGELDVVLTGTDTYRSIDQARKAAEAVIDARSHDTLIQRIGGREEKV